MTDAQGTRGNEATPQPGQTEPLYSDNRIKLALRQLPTRDDVKQMAYFVAAEMRDNYERDKAFWAQALAAQAAEHAAALARIAELERDRDTASRNAIHYANLSLELEKQLAERTPQEDANEREIIEGMADDWLERYEPGSDEWAQAQVIRAWLDNYSGTMYAERTPVAATPQGAIPDDTTCGLCGGRGDMWDYGKENLTCPVCNGTGLAPQPWDAAKEGDDGR